MKRLLVLLLIQPAAWPQPLRELGAAGDGKADDTAALQKAIDAGGGVRLPRGIYRITRPLVVDLDRVGPAAISGDGTATLLMAGPGFAIDLRGTHAGTADPNSLTAAVRDRQRTPTIDGIDIVGAHPEAEGIRIQGAMQATLTRLVVRNARTGILLTGRNRNVIVSDSHVYDNRGEGVLMEKLSLHQVNIVGCHISYNRGGGIVVRDSEIRNLQIGTCDIEANMAGGGPPAANLLFDTRSGSIREGALTGCTLQHTGRAPGSANVRFLGTSAKAPQKVGFFSIADNVFSDVKVNIHLRHARGVNITGNTFAQGFEHHLLVEESSNIVLGPNTMDQNPDYDQPGFRNAVVFADSTDCSIHGLHINRARAPEAALVVRRSKRVLITGATILDSGLGILLEDVEWTRVSDCLIHDRNPVAVKLTRGRNNQVEGILSPGKLDLAPGTTGQ